MYCQRLIDGQARPWSEWFWWIDKFLVWLATDFLERLSPPSDYDVGGSKIDLWDLAGGWRENVVRLSCEFIRKREKSCSSTRIWCIFVFFSLVQLLLLLVHLVTQSSAHPNAAFQQNTAVRVLKLWRHIIGTLEWAGKLIMTWIWWTFRCWSQFWKFCVFYWWRHHGGRVARVMMMVISVEF